jgi:hypothetical protein
LTADSKTFINLEGLVDVGVIDQSLPADGRTGLFEIGAYDNAKVIGELVGELL